MPVKGYHLALKKREGKLIFNNLVFKVLPNKQMSLIKNGINKQKLLLLNSGAQLSDSPHLKMFPIPIQSMIADAVMAITYLLKKGLDPP